MMPEMSSASRDTILEYLKRLRRKYNVSQSEVERTVEVIDRYFRKQKDFDIIVSDSKIVVLAKKTPTSTPDVNAS